MNLDCISVWVHMTNASRGSWGAPCWGGFCCVILNISCPCSVRGNLPGCRNPLKLAHPLVVTEDEGLVLNDGTARRSAELVAPELWVRLVASPDKIIPRI